MDDIDAGAYLTEQLRRTRPQPFEQEIVRSTRRARRSGFLLGLLSSLLIVVGFLGLSVVMDVGLVETVFGAR